MAGAAPVNFDVFLSEYITIRKPMPSSVPRGPYSVRLQAPNVSIRAHKEDLDAIDEAARLTHMSRSAFLVWCAARTAEAIIREKGEFDKQYGG